MSKSPVFVLLILVALSLSMVSCEGKSNKYGAEFTIEDKPIPVGTLLLSGEKYIGETVKVRGKLTAVCKQKGCYFSLINNSGSKVYVDLEDGKNFTVPTDSEGKMAVVEGKFLFEMDITKRGWRIIGTAVQIYES